MASPAKLLVIFISSGLSTLPIRLLSLFLPAILLLACASVALFLVADLSQNNRVIASFAPYLFILVGGVLGISFKQSRIALAAMVLGAMYFLIQQYLQTRLAQPSNYVLFSILSVLLPVQLALIALFRERGLFNIWGLSRVLFALLPYVVLFVLMKQGVLTQWFPSLPVSMIEVVFAEKYLSNAAALMFVLSAIPLLLVLVVRRTHMEGALWAVFIAVLVIFIWFDQMMISTLFTSAALIALSVSVVQHSYSMAFLDELTGIPARRALMHQLSTLGKHYAIAMVDIDHFKKFNDTYGHDVGDQVLRMVAAKISQVQGGGRAYRYGGEEFTVVFAGKNEAQAMPYLEEIREIIANYDMKIRDQDRPEDHKKGKKRRKRLDTSGNELVQVTISIGVAEKTSAHSLSADVIKSADQALYAAKEQGRNCTVACLTGELKKTEAPAPKTQKRSKRASSQRDFAHNRSD